MAIGYLSDLQAIAAQIVAGQVPGLPPIVVRVSARLTRSAGTYRPPGTITISQHFLADHGLEATLPILRHEIAHHIVRWTARRPVRPHGPEFRAVAVALDAPLHAPAFSAPRRVHQYRCPACGWTWQRGRRIGRRRRYSCARCAPRYDQRFRLVYAGSSRTEASGHAKGDGERRT
ncbi:MAG: SprT-like domain-containing protein [Dehalococcoidia bacterium]